MILYWRLNVQNAFLKETAKEILLKWADDQVHLLSKARVTKKNVIIANLNTVKIFFNKTAWDLPKDSVELRTSKETWLLVMKNKCLKPFI